MKQKSFHQINYDNNLNFMLISKTKISTLPILSERVTFHMCHEKGLPCYFTLSAKISQNCRRYE